MPPDNLRSRKRPRSPIRSGSLLEFGSVKACRISDSVDGKPGDEVDELDLIGISALEDYESTQRESHSQNSIPGILEPNGIPVSHSIPTQHSGGVDYKFSVEKGKEENAQIMLNFPPDETRSPICANAKQSGTSLSAAVKGASADSEIHLEAKVLYLQEQNYTKDGEVKVLRGEKERLERELKKKSEQLECIQTQLNSEKRDRELAAAKEKDSSLTRLQFKEQELLSLQDRCAELERKCQQDQLSQSLNTSLASLSRMPIKSQPLRTCPQSTNKKNSLYRVRESNGDHVSTASQNTTTEFLSTETFMPLSQLNSGGDRGIGGLISVPVEPSRPARKGRQQQPKGSSRRGYTRNACGQNKSGATRSRSISPVPSEMKSMKRKSRSGDGHFSRSEGILEPGLEIYAMQSNPTSYEASPPLPPLSLPKIEKDLPLVLSVPGRELDGDKILMLLIKGNLQKPPSLISAQQMEQKPHTLRVGTTSSGSNQPSQLQPQNEITGFLSLLSHATKHFPSSFSSSFGNAPHSTPVVTLFHSPSSPSSPLLASTSIPDISPLRTPSRKQSLIPAKPHTLARTNLAQGRVRQNSCLLMSARIKSFSATNTPIRAPPLPLRHQQSISGSLISSISADSLHNSMGELLASSEISQFAFLSSHHQRMGRKRVEREGRHGGNGYLNVIKIFLEVGNLIVKYNEEQMCKIRSLQTSAFSSSSSEGSSECLDTSLLMSPRSSSKASSISELSSSSFFSPTTGNQQLLTDTLYTLETLVAYSKQVREQILLQPLEFVIDSRPSSSLGMHLNNPASSNSSSIEGASSSVGGDMMDAEEEGEAIGRRGEGGNVREAGEVSTLARVCHKLAALHDTDKEQEMNSLKEHESVS